MDRFSRIRKAIVAGVGAAAASFAASPDPSSVQTIIGAIVAALLVGFAAYRIPNA